MRLYKVVIFGDLPLATKLAQFFLLKKEFVIKLVVIGNRNPNNNDPFKNTPLLEDFAIQNNIPIYYNFGEFKNLEKVYDIGISARFSKLIPNFVLEKFKYGIVNLHGGLLPKFAGNNSCVHALIENSDIMGGTMHWIDETIDTGFIISKKEFKIGKFDTSFKLYQKTQIGLLEMAIDFFENYSFIDGPKEKSIYKYDKKDFKFYKKKDLLDKRDLSKYFNLKDFDTLYRNVRAFTFPGKEKSYIVQNNQKIFLSLNSN